MALAGDYMYKNCNNLETNAPMAVTGQDDAAKAEWWSLSDLPHLAFDHYDIMQDAIRTYNLSLFAPL